MQALLFDRPAPDTSASRVGELPDPTPGPGQVSIDVRFAGINFKDVMARRGDPGYVGAWPHVPGLEAAGTIRALGPGVTGFSPGDVVVAYTGEGALAEVVLADARLVAPVPPGLPLPLAGVALGAPTTAELLIGEIGRLQAGDVVLVHSAAGAVGQAVAQLARAKGARRLLGTVGAASRREGALQAGYDAAFARGPTLASEVRVSAGDHGVDLVLDPQGTTMLVSDLDVVAPGGRIVLFGNATGSPLDALPPPQRFFATNSLVGGFSLASLAVHAPLRLAAALARTLERLEAGTMTADLEVIPSLDDAADAQQALAEGRGGAKQVVHVTGR